MSVQVPVQVLASRSYSFTGDKGDAVALVEVSAMVQLGQDTVVGKVNMRGGQALKPGQYVADLVASEKQGKLSFSLRDFRAVPVRAQ